MIPFLFKRHWLHNKKICNFKAGINCFTKGRRTEIKALDKQIVQTDRISEFRFLKFQASFDEKCSGSFHEGPVTYRLAKCVSIFS